MLIRYGYEITVTCAQPTPMVPLIAERDGKTTPDMITLLDAETGAPVTADGMRYDIRVVALAYTCAEQWRTRKGLKLVGPRYFGHDLDFQPFNPRAAREAGPIR